MPGFRYSQETSGRFGKVGFAGVPCPFNAKLPQANEGSRRELRRRIAVGYYQYLLVPQLSAKTEVAAKAPQV